MAQETIEDSRFGGVPRQPFPASSDGSLPAALLDALEGTLADFLAVQIGHLEALDPALGAFARTTRGQVLAGGKRLRPAFAYWGWRGVTGPGESVEPILPALGALELMHTFALVHDDVMDESATRRGQPTAHRIFAGQHAEASRRGDADRFGTTAAILLGDLCLVWADQLLARAALPTTTLLAVRAGYDRMRVEAVAGQYLDVLGENEPDAWSIERALLVARNKTASYTVLRPLQFGLALAAQCRPEVDEAYRAYGVAVGEAFQLRDDMLGVYGDPAVTGKPAGDDLRSGKPTALLMLARQLAEPAQLAELASLDAALQLSGSAGAPNQLCGGAGDQYRDGHGLDLPALNRCAELIDETGAPARIEEMISQRVAEGIAALADAPIHADARAALTDLAVRATHRPA